MLWNILLASTAWSSGPRLDHVEVVPNPYTIWYVHLHAGNMSKLLVCIILLELDL